MPGNSWCWGTRLSPLLILPHTWGHMTPCKYWPACDLLMLILLPSSLFQRTLGSGEPVAIHVSVTLAPSRTITSVLLSASSMLGGTETNMAHCSDKIWFENILKISGPWICVLTYFNFLMRFTKIGIKLQHSRDLIISFIGLVLKYMSYQDSSIIIWWGKYIRE